MNLNQTPVKTHIKIIADLFYKNKKVFSAGDILRIILFNNQGCAAADEKSREIFLVRPGDYEFIETAH